MSTYVLVPGFWLGGWAWDAVADELRGAGHDVLQVTLTGLAERASELSAEVDVDTHIADVLAAVGDRRDVILVGHSGATMPVTGAADRIPGQLARVVYVDTAPLPDGWAQRDFLEPEERAEQEKSVGGGFAIPVPDAFDGVEEVHRLRATPQPWGAARRPLARPRPDIAVPKTMICTTIPLPAVRQMIASGLPAFSALAGDEWTFQELPSSHWPMFTAPKALASLLLDA
ncbi:alpha/beta hydrolase [Actinocorallia longicatena]|uniref:Alpha/beta fold hydrolase n=1 Tax=Actinocorallia longicatena TaxID=111803 RepID=A0ABP6QEH4_9ACTN